mgnify:CR=1 FL=1
MECCLAVLCILIGWTNLYSSARQEITYLGFATKHLLAKDGFLKMIQKGHLEICRAIMDNLDDKNPRNNDGATPLYLAANCGHLKICQLIIANVDNQNIPDNLGNTPLHIAAFYGHYEVCRAFIETLDDNNPMNNNGKTPFCVATEQGHLEICKLFVSQRTAKLIMEAHICNGLKVFLLKEYSCDKGQWNTLNMC